MSVCHEVIPVLAGVDAAHTAACHLYPGADPTYPTEAWEPAGRRLRLAEPPLSGTLR
jgi:hypothetical protein